MRVDEAVVFRGLLFKWLVSFQPEGRMTMTCAVSFWRKKNADDYAATLEDAYWAGYNRAIKFVAEGE